MPRLLRDLFGRAGRAALLLLPSAGATSAARSALAQAVPTTARQYLSGTGRDHTVPWEFRVSGGRGAGRWAAIPVPSNWEMQGSGTCHSSDDWSRAQSREPAPDSVGEYRHAFRVPAGRRGRRVTIVVGASMTDTDVAGGTGADRVTAAVAGVWPSSAESPERFRVRLRLVEGTVVRHEVADTFGFRTVEVRAHDGFYVNGVPVRLKGANRHAFRPTTGRATKATLYNGLAIELDNYQNGWAHDADDNHVGVRTCLTGRLTAAHGTVTTNTVACGIGRQPARGRDHHPRRQRQGVDRVHRIDRGRVAQPGPAQLEVHPGHAGQPVTARLTLLLTLGALGVGGGGGPAPRAALPMADHLVGAAGYELVGRVDRVLLNLHQNGRFTVDVHYPYAHVVAGTALPLGRDWSDADAGGAWTVRHGRLTLLPDPSRHGRPAPALGGDWRQNGIVMDLCYAGRYTAGRERQYVVRLQRAPGVY